MKVNIGPYIHSEEDGDRVVNVIIDDHDTWNMDHTLALIIHPMLLQLKKNKAGAPYVDDEVVPNDIRSTMSTRDDDVDEFWHKRWDWVLDEMIWSFNYILESWNGDDPFDKEREERAQRGFELFGKYFQCLWE